MRGARLVVVFVLLAGCAGSDEPADSSSPIATPSTSSPTETAAPPLETTETLFFLPAPDLTLDAPTGSEPETTPYSFGGGFGGAVPRWEYGSKADASPSSVDATVWIRVVEPLAVPPAQAPCVWSLEVYAGDEFAFPVMCSGPVGPTIMAGDYELKFSSSSPNQTAAAAGTSWAFQMRRTAFSPTPNEAVLILVNSEDFPSNVRIAGFAEPKPVVS